MMRYLPREDAPFSTAVWEAMDAAVLGTAKSQLAGRRLLEITGPFGLGYRAVDLSEQATGVELKHGAVVASLSAASVQPVPMLSAGFSLALRDLAAVEEQRAPLDLRTAACAAAAVAQLEDKLVFEGAKSLGIAGLLTAAGSSKVKVGNWTEVGSAADDLIAAVNALDAAGFSGPYTAALAPALYNALLLRYPQGNMTQLDHARNIISAGLVKASTLKSGGVVMAAGKHVASLLIGQDLTTEFVGPAGMGYEFVVLESLTPRITIPEAICVLEQVK
jgi:uncharacterized linocin/CFP29 family protein